MPTRLGLIAVGIVALTLWATGAQAAGGRTAGPCLVQAARPVTGKFTARLVLHGKATCSEARSTYRAFLHAEDSGACGSGRICDELLGGGWRCAFLSSVESKQDGGLQAECSRKGSSFGVYNAAAKTRSARDASACAPETVFGGRYAGELTLRFVLRGRVTCSKAHSLTYFHEMSTQGCRQHGTACIFTYEGGWSCSLPIPALKLKALAGCQTYSGQPVGSVKPTASVTVYRVTRREAASGRAML
jgi:hypothetical protein